MMRKPISSSIEIQKARRCISYFFRYLVDPYWRHGQPEKKGLKSFSPGCLEFYSPQSAFFMSFLRQHVMSAPFHL
jgi:hypothetical protein